MREKAYYNEMEPFAAAWLRNLISAGHIAPGDVDERSIEDVRPDDLRGYAQCHFFAGIGVWSYSLRLAGWPDDRPVWTGSCPCQPFSAAGERGGTADERHLWPAWFHLIEQCRPPIIFGEQVAAAGAVGRAAAGVPCLRDREAVLGVLRELQGQSSHGLHGLRAGSGARSEAEKLKQNQAAAEGVARQEARSRLGQRSETSSADEGTAFRSGPCEGSGENRRRHLRDDGNPVRPFDTAGMECPFAGPDRAREGLHDGECQSRLVLAERDGEHMGPSTDRGDSVCDFGEAPGSLERTIESLGREPESKDGQIWFDALRSDLERAHYAIGACITPSAGSGAPHIRQRLRFVAERVDLSDGRRQPWGAEPHVGAVEPEQQASRLLDVGRVGADGRLADAELDGQHRGRAARPSRRGEPANGGQRDSRPGPVNGFWRDADWLFCRDGKWRPVEPGTFPLVDGAPARVGRLRAYGNAIDAQATKHFIEAYLETRGDFA